MSAEGGPIAAQSKKLGDGVTGYKGVCRLVIWGPFMDELDHLIKKNIEAVVEAEEVPAEALRRAKNLMEGKNVLCPHCKKPITPFKKPQAQQKLWNTLWLGLAGLMLFLSFVFPRYFFQCLALMLLFGFKWVIEQRASRTQVLIYKALKEEEGRTRIKSLHESSHRL